MTGHTDNTGRRSHNRKLSQQRAKVVREYLLKQGVPEEKLRVQFFGERKPAASNKTDDGRRKNRRVTVMVTR